MNAEIEEAMHIASEIIEYCQGDAWERECTEFQRTRFAEIYEKYFPKPKEAKPLFHDVYCNICDRHFINTDAYNGHLEGKKHKLKATQKKEE
jgi:hypothetical protein